MKENFEITGYFYEKKGYKFRKYLNIIKRESNGTAPDIIIVMMNPGSSKPLNGIENIETIAIPDHTQTQIMKIMKTCEFNYARILNLSDLREPKSAVFYKTIEALKNRNIAHSIFDKARHEDFEKLFIKNVPVIYAWGVHKNLSELAINAMKRINETKPIGLTKSGFEYAYYHPLPQNYYKQQEWIEKITEMIKTV